MRRLLKIILLFLLCAPALRASDIEAELREEVRFLSGKLCGGRGSGTAGAQSAAFYIFRELRNAGLRTTVQSFPSGDRAAHNIVAMTPGWYEEYIVVGAYFDGIGSLGGELYPGADSNASGVAALLSLARSLPERCSGKTGLIFVAFDGHNSSLGGSETFVERNRGKYKVSMMVNLDILGSSLVPVQSSRPDYLIVLGGGSSRMSLERANRTARLSLSYDYYGSPNFTELFYRKISDQSAFLRERIPSVMFTSGITLNTNRTTDTEETLDFPVFARRVLLIGEWLGEMLGQ